MTLRLACLVSFASAVALGGLGCTLVAGGDHDSASPMEPESALGSSAVNNYSADAASPAFDFDALGGNSGDGSSSAPPEAGMMDPEAGALAVTGHVVFGVDGQNELVRFGTASPGAVSGIPITGLAPGEWILGIDFRAKTGALYGMSSNTTLYMINTTTGVATAVGVSGTPGVMGQAHGFDIDPVSDRIRIQTDIDQNLRVDPQTGAVTQDAMLAFASGDPNYEQSPNLVGTAYTNSVSGAQTTTMLYAIDSTRNLLTKLVNPNGGAIDTVGALGVDIDQAAGFDIWGKDPKLEAFAALTVNGVTGLYKIDLKTGAAAAVGQIAHARPLVGIAIAP